MKKKIVKVKKFLVVDGHMALHKFASVYPKLGITISGTHFKTGIPYGMLRTILRMQELYGANRVLVAFDPSAVRVKSDKFHKMENSRRVAYNGYKSKRKPTDQVLLDGKFLLDEFFKVLGITVAHASPEYEGDDVIGYAVRQCRNHCISTGCNGKVIILSDDKDFNQLLRAGKKFSVSAHRRGDVLFDYDSFVEKFGFKPNRFAEYLALVGDTNDEIPGIRGIGPKGATELLKNEESPVLGRLCAQDRVIFERNLTLTTLFTGNRAAWSIKHYSFDKEQLNALFKRYKMVSFLREKDQAMLAKIRPIDFVPEKR